MLEQLRKKAQHSLIWKLVICTIIIIACLVITKFGIIDYIRGPIDLTNKDDWNVKDLEGKYVTIDVDFVNMGFAEETSRNTKTNVTKTTSICYVCERFNPNTNYDVFYAVKANPRRSKGLKKLYDDYDETNPEAKLTPYKITGTFKKMSGKLLSLYDESIEDNFGTEALDYAVSYCIYDETIAGHSYIIFWGLNGAAVICLIGMIVSIIRFLAGSYEGYMKKFLAKNPMESMQGIEADFAAATGAYQNYRIGRKYFFYSKGNTMSLLPLSTQVWAYYYRRTGRNAVSQINFYDINKKATYVSIPQEPAQSVLQALANQCPQMVVGYDADLNRVFKQNFNQFLTIKYNSQSYEDMTSAASQEPAESKNVNWNL